MISEKTLNSLEYYKILEEVSTFAVLQTSKSVLKDYLPLTNLKKVKLLLDKTKEAYNLLYILNCSGLSYFDDLSNEIRRSEMGSTLNFKELLAFSKMFAVSRRIKKVILSQEEDLPLLKELAERIYIDEALEKDITSKILSEDTMSDTASEKLFTLRQKIKSLNAKIREKLNSYLSSSNKFMQDNLVTMRSGRYVIPVKSEYRSSVKGFIHDQSASGATVFIEPEQVIEYNNELKTVIIEEQAEIQRILVELTSKIGLIANELRWNIENLTEIDITFAKATYAYKHHCVYPELNDEGQISLIKARHPLIDKSKVVPINVSIGENYNFLVISGPNTGGKTVTLKITGLFTLMIMSGIFVPCSENSKLSVFENIFTDIGDEQSISESLSTFSSHMSNIINTLKNANQKSLILLDEIGAGTDPEEGASLAIAVIKALLNVGAYGIITTHYSRLKEYVAESSNIENASMDFNADNYAPLYKLNIGIPGTSNAIEISRRLGLPENIINDAYSYMSNDKISFEKVLMQAEITRQQAQIEKENLAKINKQKEEELIEIKKERERLNFLRSKIENSAKLEIRKIVDSKTEEAEELLEELKMLVKKSEHSSVDVITAKNIKNRIDDKKYIVSNTEAEGKFLQKINIDNLKIGDKVFSEKMQTQAVVNKISNSKNKIEITIGNIRVDVTPNDLYIVEEKIKKEPKKQINLSKKDTSLNITTELNIIGKTVMEGITELEAFISEALLKNLEEVRIIHGVGTGKLRNGVWEYLRTNKHVAEYRSGRYGEGEKGVTIIKLK